MSKLLNRDTLTRQASTLASNSDTIEVDIIAATTEDDLQSILLHLEILTRNANQLRDTIRATLENRAL